MQIVGCVHSYSHTGRSSAVVSFPHACCIGIMLSCHHPSTKWIAARTSSHIEYNLTSLPPQLLRQIGGASEVCLSTSTLFPWKGKCSHGGFFAQTASRSEFICHLSGVKRINMVSKARKQHLLVFWRPIARRIVVANSTFEFSQIIHSITVYQRYIFFQSAHEINLVWKPRGLKGRVNGKFKGSFNVFTWG